MTPSGRSNICEWCELEIAATERAVRLSTSQPPWTARNLYGALGAGLSAAIRAAAGEDVDYTLWFHRACWDKFLGLLRGRNVAFG
jgi:hypothetical protein